MTTITFKRSGGFVGQGMKYEINLHHLPSDDARKLIHLIEKAEFFNLPENLITKFMPDEYQYPLQWMLALQVIPSVPTIPRC